MRARAIPVTFLLLIVGCGDGGSPDRTDDTASGPTLRASLLQARVHATRSSCEPEVAGGSAAVQARVDAAGPEGVVVLDAGCFDIREPVLLPDGARLLGAGPDLTVLYRDPEAWANRDSAMIHVRGAEDGGGTRISGIAFVGVCDTSDSGADVGVHITDCRDFRVDDCYFEGIGSAGVSVHGVSTGVIDHCVFVDVFKQGIDNLGYGVVVIGPQDWVEDPGLGTERAVFVEDGEFVGCRHAIASNGGAHYVFRHNLVYQNVVSSSIDAHGLGYGSSRGTQCVEIYANQVFDPLATWYGIGIRGGSGVIFSNSIRGFVFPIFLVLEWGTPEELKTTYPAADQVQDLWIWENTTGDGPAEPDVHPNGSGFIEKGRDYFTEPRPQYVPFLYPHPLVPAD